MGEADINKLDASLFMPTFMNNLSIPPQYGLMNGYMQPQIPIMPTVVKNYTINAPGPTGLHDKISYIYEDMLPTINIPGKITTLKERNTLQSYLRSILFAGGDGQDINLDERSNSLMQYMKYMDLNPYNNYNLEQHPYKTLPIDFIIYRSCYPIKRDNNTTQCADNSIGINLRIYKLDYESYNIHKSINLNQPIVRKYTDFNQWREVKYYEYIRDYILKKNKCPNFVELLGYYINEKSDIDFNKINTIINPNYKPTTANTNKALIVLTEAPLYNIYGWASTLYIRDGPVKRMISTGYYNENVWYSILFQIMTALLVLQREGIYFNNFEVDHNIFIKSLSSHSNLTNFWKYVVDGIEYYVPNYGYIAMVDTNYRDNIIETSNNNLKGRKIYSEKLDDDVTNINIHDLIFDNMFKRVFTSNLFGEEFIKKGGIKPPQEISDLIRKIELDNSSKDISYFIHTYMRKFINNRIGTLLKDSEIQNIRRDNSNLKIGQIVVDNIGVDTYKFGLLYNIINNDIAVILTKNDDKNKDIIEKQVALSSLSSYSKVEVVEQNFKPNEINLNEEELIETYIL